MTNRDYFKNFSEDEFIEWLSGLGLVEEAPWLKWLDKTYCQKCEPVIGRMEGSDYEHEFAKCEFSDCDCPYAVQNLEDRDLIKMWLDAEREEI